MRRRRHEAVVGDDGGARRVAGSTAIAGLCSIWAAESAGSSGESQAAPSAGAETSSTAAAPMTSTSR